jgi:hypothetical protein
LGGSGGKSTIEVIDIMALHEFAITGAIANLPTAA